MGLKSGLHLILYNLQPDMDLNFFRVISTRPKSQSSTEIGIMFVKNIVNYYFIYFRYGSTNFKEES